MAAALTQPDLGVTTRSSATVGLDKPRLDGIFGETRRSVEMTLRAGGRYMRG